MSGLTLKLRATPPERLNLSQLTPSLLAGLSLADIERMEIGASRTPTRVGDVFAVSGAAGETLTLEGGADRLDFAGAGHNGGTIVIDGAVGAYAGKSMRAGRLDIRGDAGPWLAASLKGGLVTVTGNAGDNVGAASPEDRFGMTGGLVAVAKSIGARAGDRMRRGSIIVRERCGALAGTRMMGGTIWAEQGFGPSLGALLRRGTLIAPSLEHPLATFADCGRHDLGVLQIISRYLTSALGPLAPTPPPVMVRKLAGDMAALGKGEILLIG